MSEKDDDEGGGGGEHPYLLALLKERLPQLGLDASIYAPYILGVVEDVDDDDDDDDDGALDGVMEMLQDSSEDDDDDDITGGGGICWVSLREEIIQKIQQDKEWKKIVEKLKTQEQQIRKEREIIAAKKREEEKEEGTQERVIPGANPKRRHGPANLTTSEEEEEKTNNNKMLLQWFMCEENGFTTRFAKDEPAAVSTDSTSTSVVGNSNSTKPEEEEEGKGKLHGSLCQRGESVGSKNTTPGEEGQCQRGESGQEHLHHHHQHMIPSMEPIIKSSSAPGAVASGGSARSTSSRSSSSDPNCYYKKSKKYEYWYSRIKADGWELGHSPYRTNKSMVLLACQQKGKALRFANSFLRNDPEVVLAACCQDGCALAYASEELRGNKEIVMVAAQSNPDALKYALGGLNQDPDCLVASGLWDRAYHHPQQQDQQIMKIVLSTRFALTPGSASKATQFAILLKERLRDSFTKWLVKWGYITENTRLDVYSPNAFDKDTCDPNWTNLDWPCRGTFETCRMTNPLLKMGVPQDTSCWRYSFRYQLEQAKKMNGFMIQLVEVGGTSYYTNGNTQRLGQGQLIEQEMAKDIAVKVFRVHAPIRHRGKRYEREQEFQKEDIDKLFIRIRQWYDGNCKDLSECTIQFDHNVSQRPPMPEWKSQRFNSGTTFSGDLRL